jgi:hypothetical protein
MCDLQRLISFKHFFIKKNSLLLTGREFFFVLIETAQQLSDSEQILLLSLVHLTENQLNIPLAPI